VGGIEILFFENGMVAQKGCGNVDYRWSFDLNYNSSCEKIEMVR